MIYHGYDNLKTFARFGRIRFSSFKVKLQNVKTQLGFINHKWRSTLFTKLKKKGERENIEHGSEKPRNCEKNTYTLCLHS